MILRCRCCCAADVVALQMLLCCKCCCGADAVVMQMFLCCTCCCVANCFTSPSINIPEQLACFSLACGSHISDSTCVVGQMLLSMHGGVVQLMLLCGNLFFTPFHKDPSAVSVHQPGLRLFCQLAERPMSRKNCRCEHP